MFCREIEMGQENWKRDKDERNKERGRERDAERV